MRIAMVSEHASPLAALGGVDAGGQNVHVAALACELARHCQRALLNIAGDVGLVGKIDAGLGQRGDQVPGNRDDRCDGDRR